MAANAKRDLIVANITASRLTLLYAASGVGKSSVLRAGVLPLARRLAEESYEDLGVAGALTVYVSDWTGDASTTVARAVSLAVASPPEATSVLPSQTARLDVPWLRGILQQSRASAIHLILDQFEEYFLYHAEGRGGKVSWTRSVTS